MFNKKWYISKKFHLISFVEFVCSKVVNESVLRILGRFYKAFQTYSPKFFV